ncbi:hypothetical protein [Staphylococcus capitis]|uniref:hypothetical protein n=2 Tax=Staphylococcus TaxID=1279 RepID=UPI003CEAC9CF
MQSKSKAIVLSLASTMVATTLLSPVTHASEVTTDNGKQQTQRTTSSQGNSTSNYNYDRAAQEAAEEANGGKPLTAERSGKIGYSVKAARVIMKKNKRKINSAIRSAINKAPVSKKVKKNLKRVISVETILHVTAHYTNLGDNIEGAIQQGLTHYAHVPGPVAFVIAKTISLLIPVL